VSVVLLGGFEPVEERFRPFPDRCGNILIDQVTRLCGSFRPRHDGLLIQHIGFVEGSENVRSTRQEFGFDDADQIFDARQQIQTTDAIGSDLLEEGCIFLN